MPSEKIGFRLIKAVTPLILAGVIGACGPVSDGEMELEQATSELTTGADSAAASCGTAACSGTANPLPSGEPRCCAGGALIRPAGRRCEWPRDLSPYINRHGIYMGERDGNFMTPGDGTVLEVLAAYVIDNGEGTDWPHGPIGNLHFDVFRTSEPIHQSPDGAGRRRIGPDRMLRGPHRTHGTTDEWLDDEVLQYRNAGLFRWCSYTPAACNRIVLRIRESDGSEDGSWGRRDDVLGMELISRRDTSNPCGIWVPFHKYTNDHPRRRLSTVTMWLKLRTR